jgi:hypothetical protein
MIRTDLCDVPVWVGVLSHSRAANAHPQSVHSKIYGPVTWYVNPPDQLDDYIRMGAPRIQLATGMMDARNRILMDGFSRGLPVLEMNDDVTRIVKAIEKPESTPELRRYTRVVCTLADLVQDVYTEMLAHDLYMGGPACTSNLLGYNIDRPTSFQSFIEADIMLFRPNELFFDEMAALKEDYDLTCQHIAHYGGVVRRNQWLIEAMRYTNAGGVNTGLRNPTNSLNAIEYLRAKWGDETFPPHPTRGQFEVKMRVPRGGFQDGQPYSSPFPALPPIKEPLPWLENTVTPAPLPEPAGKVRAGKALAVAPTIYKGKLTEASIVGKSLAQPGLFDEDKTKPIRVTVRAPRVKLPSDFRWSDSEPVYGMALASKSDMSTPLSLKLLAVRDGEWTAWVVPWALRDSIDTEWTQVAALELLPVAEPATAVEEAS